MLAYVFWHWPLPDTDPDAYEQALIAFHDVLSAASPEGFGGSAVARVDPLPFDGRPGGPAGPVPGRAAYEDWYLVSGAAALDPLDAAAVGGRCGAAHAAVAALAGGGTAGLYRLVAGELPLGSATTARWLDMGGGERAGVVDELTAAASAAGGGLALWMRRMTLGPAPELCLLYTGEEGADGEGSGGAPLPAAARSALDQSRHVVWAGGQATTDPRSSPG